MKKILLVDDSKTSLYLARTILEKNRFEIVTATSGEEALRRASEESPDLILLDLVMPGIDGFETLRRLREEAPTMTVPVILVTTRGEPSYVEEGYETGCNDYVTKPVDAEELLAKVANLIGPA